MPARSSAIPGPMRWSYNGYLLFGRDVLGRMVRGELGSRLEDALWGNPDTLQDHFDRYGSDFGATDPIDLQRKRAVFLTTAPTCLRKSILKMTIRMFNPDTNIFGAYNADGSTKSLFKPTSPDHWSRQKGKPSSVDWTMTSLIGTKSVHRFPCPLVWLFDFLRSPGTHEFCPICGWENDLSQLRFPGLSGANKYLSRWPKRFSSPSVQVIAKRRL